MKVLFTAPTESFPFFHNVKIVTKNGTRRVVEHSERGTVPALFATKQEMADRITKMVAGH